MRAFPALEIAWPVAPAADVVERLLASIDDVSPTAVEDHALGVRVFFSTDLDRDAAAAIVLEDAPDATVTSLLVPDDNWAERSQAALQPVRVGRVVIAPPWAKHEPPPDDGTIVITIQPSMGFGTGHHQSTRLCLTLLQRHPLVGGAVLDIGTGSGVLAIAAWRLGAVSALGVDLDRDALTAAAENVERNRAGDAVSIAVADITRDHATFARRFDLAFANITGAMLRRHAAHVASALADGGVLITSGFQSDERDDVVAAFAAEGLEPIEEAEEDSWMATAFQLPRRG